jgi:hypothetical protein
MYIQQEQPQPVPHMTTPVTILFPAWKVVIEAFCSVLDMLDEPLHQILPLRTVKT